MTTPNERVIRYDPCPSCPSSDAFAIYSNHGHCYSCGYHVTLSNENVVPFDIDEPKEAVVRDILPPPQRQQPGMKDRNLLANTINTYKVTINSNPDNDVEAVFPRFNEKGVHTANQVRLANKKFRCEGEINKATLFGQQLFPAGGRSITVTEGYYDTLSGYEMTGSRYPNVGVMSASTAKKEVIQNFEYLNSFEKIILNFDSDEPGQKAANECAQLFAPGKSHILKLSEGKDANEYQMKGLGKKYVDEWFRAPAFMPDGLKLGSELWGDIINHKDPKSVPYPWATLNHQTYGIRLSEVTLITAPTGVGKTSIVKAIEHALLTNPELVEAGIGVGIAHLEEPKYDTAIGLMSIEAQKPFHLPDTPRSEEELRKAYDSVINTNRVVIWDHFGSNDVDVVLSKIRHMAALGCKYIVLDHLSIIVSDQSGDERKQLDEISTKIKTLCMNLHIAVIAVIHVNRQGEIRGSAGPEQIANIVIRLERDKKEVNAWRRNITKLSVEKNRFCGRTGPSSYLFYNEDTGCLEELTKEQIDEYEAGGTGAGQEFGF